MISMARSMSGWKPTDVASDGRTTRTVLVSQSQCVRAQKRAKSFPDVHHKQYETGDLEQLQNVTTHHLRLSDVPQQAKSKKKSELRVHCNKEKLRRSKIPTVARQPLTMYCHHQALEPHHRQPKWCNTSKIPVAKWRLSSSRPKQHYQETLSCAHSMLSMAHSMSDWKPTDIAPGGRTTRTVLVSQSQCVRAQKRVKSFTDVHHKQYETGDSKQLQNVTTHHLSDIPQQAKSKKKSAVRVHCNQEELQRSKIPTVARQPLTTHCYHQALEPHHRQPKRCNTSKIPVAKWRLSSSRQKQHYQERLSCAHVWIHSSSAKPHYSARSVSSECQALEEHVTQDPVSGNIRLTTEKHHTLLCEILNQHATHWRRIGQYLGFLPGELDNICGKPRLLMEGPESLLSEMLAVWLQWAQGDGRGSTDFARVDALKYALNKAGFGVTCTRLLDMLLSPPTLEETEISHRKSAQDVAVSVNDLRVCSSQESVSCRISAAKPTTEDRYEPRCLSACEQYAMYLKCYYTHNNAQDEKFPYIVARYIRLAVINKDFRNREDSYRCREARIHGSIDILKEKYPLEINEIFNPDLDHTHNQTMHLINKVLIEGAPGIGKSTLSWEICAKWAKGKLFTSFSLVVLLRFRDKQVQDAKTLSDLFGTHYYDPMRQQRITDDILSNHGNGLLLILDGYDEVPASLQNTDSIFLDLIAGKTLPKATVIVTTRPTASFKLHHLFRSDNCRRIEVLGFDTKGIDQYIQQVFTDCDTESDELKDFKQYLDLYPHIYSMMYVPINSAIVAHVYQECKSASSIVPKTMTQLYSALVKILLVRYIKEHPVYTKDNIMMNFTDFTDLPKPIEEHFQRVCKIAYSGIIKQRTELIFSNLGSDFNTLGLMQSCPELYIGAGEAVTYNFLHLTIQEFLAANYVSLLQGDTLQKTLQRLSGHPVVMQFLFGLHHAKGPLWKMVTVNQPESVEGNVPLSTLHYLFETQDPSGFCEALGCSEMYFCTENTLQPFDSYVLGYCVVNCMASSWVIDLCTYGEIDFKIFSKAVISQSSNVQQTVTLKGITNDGLCNLSNAYESFHTVQCLNIVTNVIHSQGAMHLAKLLRLNCALNHINLNQSRIGNSGTIELAKGLGTSCTVERLELKSNGIQSEEACIHLAEALKTNTSLKHVDLSENKIGNKGVSHLASGLEKNVMLQYFDLSGNTIEMDGAYHLGYALKINSTLKYLDLSVNRISDKGAVHMAKALEINSSLRHLCLRYNGLQNDGAIALSEALKTNSSLEYLELSDNGIQNDGAICLAKALETNTTLQYLDLTFNSIQALGAIQFANVLQANTSIEHLILNGNLIHNEGVINLAQTLRTNSTLEQLGLRSSGLHKDGVSELSSALKENSSLDHLDLFGNKICSKGAAYLAKALNTNFRLKHLDLGYNVIHDEGVIQLAIALKTNCSLVFLDLRHNKIQDKGAIVLAETLQTNSTLKHLDLSDNGIKNEGAHQFAEALTLNRSLVHLGFRSVYIDDGGCQSIATMLRHNISIKTLDLSENFSITSDGVSELIVSLNFNTSLETLMLSKYHRLLLKNVPKRMKFSEPSSPVFT